MGRDMQKVKVTAQHTKLATDGVLRRLNLNPIWPIKYVHMNHLPASESSWSRMHNQTTTHWSTQAYWQGRNCRDGLDKGVVGARVTRLRVQNNDESLHMLYHARATIFRIAMCAHYLLLVVFIPTHSVTIITKKCFVIRISIVRRAWTVFKWP